MMMNDSVSTHFEPHVIAINPARPTAAPAYPPISACDELDGIPNAHVMMFQVMAPSSPAKITLGFTTLCSIIPPPIALATASDPVKAAAKLNNAAQKTAAIGLSTRVPTIVA